MNIQEKADYLSSNRNPSMDRIRDLVMSKPSGEWTLMRSAESNNEVGKRVFEIKGK